MGRRTGDWRDLLSTYVLALKPNKVYVGYRAVLLTIAVMAIASVIYSLLVAGGLIPDAAVVPGLRDMGAYWREGAFTMIDHFRMGTGGSMLGLFACLLNPFYGSSVAHFMLSVLTYIALFFVWSGAGGMISRLTALEYARDDLPTLADGREMLRGKRMAYFLAPVWPLLLLVFLAVLNFLGGLVASIPYVGRILLVFPGLPMLLVTSLMMVMIVLFGVLSYGMMAPAISVGGKDALDGWSTAYTYVLWGSGRYILYTAIAFIVGLLSFVFATWLTEMLLYVLTSTVNVGYVARLPWVNFSPGGPVTGLLGEGGFVGVMSYIVAVLMLAVRAVPLAFLVSFFFSANTVIFFLLRKHVDSIEIEEIYDEAEQEDLFEEIGGEEEFGETGEAGSDLSESEGQEQAAEAEETETEEEEPGQGDDEGGEEAEQEEAEEEDED